MNRMRVDESCVMSIGCADDVSQTRSAESSGQVSAFVRVLVDRSPHASVAIAVDGSIVHTNALFEVITARSRASLFNQAFVPSLVPPAAARSASAAIARALAGESTTVDATVVGAGGTWSELMFDALVLDESGKRTLLLTLRTARLVKETVSGAAFAGSKYVVRLRAGTLTVDDGEHVGGYPAGSGVESCHKRLANSPLPCAGCPALATIRLHEQRTAIIETTEQGAYALVRARPCDDDGATIERLVLDGEALTLLLKARIDRLAAEAGVSPRERDVLDLMVLGRSLEEVGSLLGISRHTAKFHQANILEKLGADSRFDLLRVLL